MSTSTNPARFQVRLGGDYEQEDEPGTSGGTGDASFDPNDKYEPTYVSVVANGEIGECRIVGARLPEDFDSDIDLGQAIQVVDTGDSEDDSDTVVFDGVIVKKHITIGGQSTTSEAIAYNGGDYLLHRIGLHGQYRRSPDKESDFWENGPQEGDPIEVTLDTDLIQIDTPLCFNPDGSPNRTQDSYYTTADDGTQSDDFNCFEVPFRSQVNSEGDDISASYWTLVDAITYLLNVTKASWAIDPSSYTTTTIVAALPQNPVVSNVSCEGKSLAQALTELLTPHNYGYWVDPGLNENDLHEIHFFARGDSANATTLKLSARGTNAGESEANAVNLDLTFDSTAIVNRVEAYGDRISYTTLLHTTPPSSTPKCPKLVRGWKAADLEFVYEADGSTVNPYDVDFRKKYANPQLIIPPGVDDAHLARTTENDDDNIGIYGVGRMYLVNLGESSEDDLEDLTQDLTVSSDGNITGNNSVDPRRAEKPELYDRNTRGGLLHQEDAVVEMSFDAGTNWNIVEKSEYRLLPDSMGLVFVNPSLERLGILFKTNLTNWTNGTSYWQALSDDIKNSNNPPKLQIRVLCAVKSDERLSKITDNDGSVSSLATTAIYNNPGYKRCVYNSAIDNAVYYVKYPPAQITQDDTSHLSDLVMAQLKATNRVMIQGRAQVLLQDWAEYTPGMTISSIENRSFDLSSNPTIIRVVYKFNEQQAEIVLDNHRVQSVVKARPITSAQDRRQHQLGIEGVTPFTGGQRVPYLPGDQKSYEEYLRQGGGF